MRGPTTLACTLVPSLPIPGPASWLKRTGLDREMEVPLACPAKCNFFFVCKKHCVFWTATLERGSERVTNTLVLLDLVGYLVTAFVATQLIRTLF